MNDRSSRMCGQSPWGLGRTFIDQTRGLQLLRHRPGPEFQIRRRADNGRTASRHAKIGIPRHIEKDDIFFDYSGMHASFKV